MEIATIPPTIDQFLQVYCNQLRTFEESFNLTLWQVYVKNYSYSNPTSSLLY